MKFAKPAAAFALASALLLSACGSKSETGTAAGDEVYEIGILNLVTHEALDAVQNGFVDALAEAGYKDGEKVNIDIQNAQNDQSTVTAIANQFALDGKDLVLGIATPSAQALAQAITDTPVLFGAVTDPVAAKLAASWEKPGGNVTGESDMNPVEDQLKLLQEIKSDAKTVGIVYASGEVNSEVQVKAAQEAATALGLTIETAAVSGGPEVQQAAESLDVDAYYVPTDNTVVSGIAGLIGVAEGKQALVISSDSGSVQNGAAASLTVNYEQQGRDLAATAISILKDGANPGDIAVGTQDTFDLSINEAAAERMGSALPEAVVSRAVNKF